MFRFLLFIILLSTMCACPMLNFPSPKKDRTEKPAVPVQEHAPAVKNVESEKPSESDEPAEKVRKEPQQVQKPKIQETLPERDEPLVIVIYAGAAGNTEVYDYSKDKKPVIELNAQQGAEETQSKEPQAEEEGQKGFEHAVADVFKCDESRWFDITCRQKVIEENREKDDGRKYDYILVDTSSSLGAYDPLENDTCLRAELVLSFKNRNRVVKLYWHADALAGPVDYLLKTDMMTRIEACRSQGQNNTAMVLKQLYKARAHRASSFIMITDLSEQNRNLTEMVKGLGGKEVFIRFAEVRSFIEKELGWGIIDEKHTQGNNEAKTDAEHKP